MVVYRGVSLKKVKAAYPVNKEAKLDYRYVEYSKAVQWHDSQIASFNNSLSNGKGDVDIAPSS